MTRLRLTRVWPKDLSSEEVLRLFAARGLNLGKPAEFDTMLRRVFSGEWDLYRLDGAIKGVCVLHGQEGRLNIYYLHGEGLFGKIRALAEALLDIAAKQGLSGLACMTRSSVRARLFGMVPGARVTHRKDWYLLELDDHGWKTERSRRRNRRRGNGHDASQRAADGLRVSAPGTGQLRHGSPDDADGKGKAGERSAGEPSETRDDTGSRFSGLRRHPGQTSG